MTRTAVRILVQRAGLASLLLVLGGCAERIPFERETSSPPLDHARYGAAAALGADIYEIDAAASVLLVRVGRDGTMAHLGHDHAVASEDLAGMAAVFADMSQSHADIVMPLRNLVVDKAEYRQTLALDTHPDEDDIAGTYSNMRRVLEAETYPWARVRVELVDATGRLARVSITMHGMSVERLVPLSLDILDDQLRATGEFAVSHTDFGLTPFSAAGGLIRVADELAVRFELVAKRISFVESGAD